MSKKKSILFIILALIIGAALGVGVTLGITHANNTGTVASTDQSGTCGDQLTWSYDADSKTLTVSGTGKMVSYDDNTKYPWYGLDFSTLTIEDGVTSIGYGAFAMMNSLVDVSIGSDVETIEFAAFTCCYNLKTLVIPPSVTTVGDRAFEGLRNLNFLAFTDHIENIGKYAFNLDTENLDYLIYCGTEEELKDTGISSKVLSQPDDIFYHLYVKGGHCMFCGEEEIID